MAQKGKTEKSKDTGITPEQARRLLAKLRAWFSAAFADDSFGKSFGKIAALAVLDDLQYAIQLRAAADYVAEPEDGEINRIGRDVRRTPSLAAARDAVDAAFKEAQRALLKRHRGAKARLRAVSVLVTINVLDDGNPMGMEIHASDSSGASEISDMFRDLGEVYPTEKSRLPSPKTMDSLRLKDAGFPDDDSSAPHSRIGVSWHIRVVDLEKKADKSADSKAVVRDSLVVAPPDATMWLTYEVFGERKQNPGGNADRFLTVDLVSQRLVWRDGKWRADKESSKPQNAPKKKSARSFWKYEIVAAVDADKNGSGPEKRRGDNNRVGKLVMGEDGSPYVYQFDRVPWDADNSPRRRRDPFVEEMMAGFDGKVHWMAWFDSKDQESSRKKEATPARAPKIARKIVVCDWSADEGEPITEAMERLGRHKPGRSLAKITNQHELLWNLQMWYSTCAIHGVARRIGAVKLDRPTLEGAFAMSPNTQEQQGTDVRGDRTFFYRPQRRAANGKNENLDNLVDVWRYEVLIDEQPSAIVQCHAQFASSWLGPWPFPVPGRFNVRREEKVPDRLEATFSFTSFVGDRTELRWARFLRHSDGKK